MKLRRIRIENVRSFLEAQEFKTPGPISILIGPNGGGKTNLLDTLSLTLRLHLLRSWLPKHSPQGEWQDRYDWAGNDSINHSHLETHHRGKNLQQVIELDVELTQRDLENITNCKANAKDLSEKSLTRYTSTPIEHARTWDLTRLQAGTIFTYKIVNNSLQASTGEAEIFRQYLQTFEVDAQLRADYAQTPLSTPMLFLPVNRSESSIADTVSLANFNEYDYKRSIDAASSRGTGSIVQLAIGRFALKYRQLLELDNGNAREAFYADPNVTAFTEALKLLGYDWELVPKNIRTNQYDLKLSKQKTSFAARAASSGEKELLTYLFAIYALNVRDALIIIDEPELHLHPRWQRQLLALFERLSKDTGNQFIMATHSPVFVAPTSIEYVSRVYAENQISRITRLGDASLPKAKHLFNIVNSQNNERLFFADIVILVEGISDRIVFEALLKHFSAEKASGLIAEVINVNGKTFFEPYRKLLNACGVRYAAIADLDYVADIGTVELKAFFRTRDKDIREKVIDDPTSIDGASLISSMEEALNTKDLVKLEELWKYIEARHRRLRSDLSEEQTRSLETFIESQKAKGLFILKRGALEAYLPEGCKGKDLENVIGLVSGADFWSRLNTGGKDELQRIVFEIVPPSDKAAEAVEVGSVAKA